MDTKRLTALVVLIGVVFGALTSLPAHAQTTPPGPVSVIILPHVTHAFDISWMDPASHRYYLGDRTNGAVDVVDTTTDTLVNQIGGFVGFAGNIDTAGPNGVLVIPETNQLWVGDGDSTVKVIDLTTGSAVKTISTGGQARADEMAYDARDHVLVVTNDAEDPPYLSFISTTDISLKGKLPFPDATNGIEQPAWSPDTGLFYQAVPSSKTNAGGEIDAVDPTTMKVTGVVALTSCTPHGTAIGPNKQLLVGCVNPGRTVIVDLTTKAVAATITKLGGSDEVWYNPGDNRYYLAASGMTTDGTTNGTVTPVLGVIDAGTNVWLQNVPTVSAAHSVAVDPQTNHVYVPLTHVGIGVYALP